MKNKEAVLQKTLDAIEKHTLFTKGDKVLIAVSGGADSVCLLDILVSIKKELGLKLGIAHLHHGIRGAEADDDAKFVASLAEKYHCRYYEKRVNIAALAEEKKVSLETAGREARYQFFLDLVMEEGYQKIVTAHNQNDVAETVLMRLIRGTGIDGLCGISVKLEDLIVRPLLSVSRNEIENYCQEHNLTFCTDRTNAENTFTRNKIRNRLLPVMKEMNPNVIANIANTAVNLKEDAGFLNAYAERLYQTLNNPHPSHKPTLLHIASLEMIGLSIRTRLLVIAAREVMGKEYTMEQKHIYSILDLCGKQSGTQVSLPNGLVVAVKYGWLEFMDSKKEKKSFFGQEAIEISVEKEYTSSEIGKKISFLERKVQKDEKLISDEKTYYFDADMLSGKKLFLRHRRPNDKMVVFPDGKRKTVQRIMIDMKIPRSLRDDIPILTAEEEVIAVLGYRISEKYKAKKTSERVLVVCYESE